MKINKIYLTIHCKKNLSFFLGGEGVNASLSTNVFTFFLGIGTCEVLHKQHVQGLLRPFLKTGLGTPSSSRIFTYFVIIMEFQTLRHIMLAP